MTTGYGTAQDIPLFAPSRATGAALRHRLNGHFADSLGYLLHACADHVPVPEARADALAERIRTGRETPFVYTLHFELLAAIEDNDLDRISALIDRLLELPPAEPGLLLTSLRPEHFPWDGEMVAGYFAAEPDAPFGYGAPDPAAVAPRHAEFEAARAVLHAAAPGLAAEFEEVETTIIVSTGVAAEGAPPVEPFQGSSALRAFGAIMTDATPDVSLVDTFLSLVHEEAHAVLFALAPGNGVVTNPDDERYSSPLREDLRPLEGIFHATFVLARMLYGLKALSAWDGLSADDRLRAGDQLAESLDLFHDGATTLRRHADMTEEGIYAMASAESYVTRTFGS